MDFTIKTYKKLIGALTAQGFIFQSFSEYLEIPASRFIILRHDVETRYGNALEIAKIQHDIGIRGSYYSRFLPDHFDTYIIREIASMGHEIGYHYDDLSHCHGNYEAALKRFEKNLATLREIAPVKTICMEGAPLSKWDNRDLWGKEKSSVVGRQSSVKNLQPDNTANPSPFTAHYKDYGIIGEPYFDIDFTQVFYLTDTGRRWDGKGSVRDKVGGRQSAVRTLEQWNSGTVEQSPRNPELKFHSTYDIIRSADAGLLPDRIMFTFHPQRWTDKPLPWLQELVMQNVKNIAKRIILSFKS